MDAFQVYAEHNQAINNYLVIYAIVICLINAIAFLLYRSAAPKAFYKGVFITLLIGGVLLGGSGLMFRQSNIQERSLFAELFAQQPEVFLKERMEAAAQFKSHFSRLLVIWTSTIAVLLVLTFLLFRRKLLIGVFTGLIICCLASLALDFFGYRADARYYQALQASQT